MKTAAMMGAAVLLAGGLTFGASAWALSPANKCESSQLRTGGRYSLCRLKTDAKAVKTGVVPDFGTCDATFSAKWANAETKGMGQCPSNSDQATIQAFISQCTDDVATALGGGTLPDLSCGNGVIDAGEDCDQSNLNLQTCMTQGFAGGLLACGAGCKFDTSGCSAVRFVDNGDGTVSDTTTGLMWEKKDNLDGSPNSADPHDADNFYTWSSSGSAPDGTLFTDFLLTLTCVSPNGTSVTGGFAGHCDWRLPTNAELQTILLQPFPCGTQPCIDSTFGPSNDTNHWSSTTDSVVPARAWAVSFFNGLVNNASKTLNNSARAVRSGP
jgi:hypothetical protein